VVDSLYSMAVASLTSRVYSLGIGNRSSTAAARYLVFRHFEASWLGSGSI
jgi:hypothetical protein